ncbi:Type 1 glutamine amidotransferase-like domain-containing protein [Microlunatus sp. Gsoil 973]|jgi:dipeptidase E|uniref:Type 1 glutamine amidotransferase-like domain-containing protein n=1 Tax=Microlunatus sp. Gsoil 973 TaxID=2672569 RepID=UPI0012B45EDA|nr:Type 1 glutamine amidotransferase-like domain-containing protein [Microlunatus sp. Gsoil 973]QGN32650.1 peptidase [Microlunatus sp. Gsoil 973]
MRLYLSSFQLGRRPELLSSLVDGGRRGWLIMNALDGLGDGVRRSAEAEAQLANLSGLGLEAAELDLRTVDPRIAEQTFGEPDFVWVRGGNVFTLRMAMATSGVDEIITQQVRRDRLVYAGYSAGPCVLAPDLTGLEHCDPVEPCIATYGDVRFDGLGILDRAFVPHLNSPSHPESQALGEVAAAYEAAGRPYWALSDGQALVIQGEDVRIV